MLDIFKNDLAKYAIDLRYAEIAQNYLKLFGYFNNTSNPQKALKSFQETFGVLNDGELGPQTLRAMFVSRCGCSDAERLEVAEARIGQKNWTIYIDGYLDSLSKDEQIMTYNKVFAHLMTLINVNIKIIDSKNSADVIIGVGRGTKYNFDGIGGTLAWAELASNQNRQQQLMIDNDETFVSNTLKRGILLFNVFYHEFIHILGLTHSKDSTALMAPFYKESVAFPTKDDINRLLNFYEKASVPVPTPTPPPTGAGKIQINIDYNARTIEIPGYSIIKK